MNSNDIAAAAQRGSSAAIINANSILAENVPLKKELSVTFVLLTTQGVLAASDSFSSPLRLVLL